MRLAKNIRRFWLWVGIILLIELSAITVWKRWYWFFPSQETSELYQRYAGSDGIDAAFVKDYRVNDTLLVDVTLLQSTSDSAWKQMTKDMNVMDLSDFSPEIRAMFEGSPQSYEYYYAPTDTIVMDGHQVAVRDIVSWSRYYKRFFIFHDVDETQSRQIVDRLTGDITY